MRIGFVVARGCFAIVTLVIGVTTAVAQSGKLPNPADPGAAAPPLKYESAFSDYQPFQEQKSNSWKQVNKEVADNPGMGSMKDMPGKTMPGMELKKADVPMSKEGAGDHDVGSMKDMPDKPMPGMDSKTADEPMSREGVGGHDMHSMKDMPDKTKPGKDSKTANVPMSKEGHDTMPKDKPQTATGQSADTQTADITGTGVVQSVDKANGKVKLTHDPIAALGWPRMTMFFRLKESALADKVKEGDKVEFTLEKSASGYVISGWQKGTAGHDMKQMKK
jgi:Cu/Ag efflux protein CusF